MIHGIPTDSTFGPPVLVISVHSQAFKYYLRTNYTQDCFSRADPIRGPQAHAPVGRSRCVEPPLGGPSAPQPGGVLSHRHRPGPSGDPRDHYTHLQASFAARLSPFQHFCLPSSSCISLPSQPSLPPQLSEDSGLWVFPPSIEAWKPTLGRGLLGSWGPPCLCPFSQGSKSCSLSVTDSHRFVFCPAFQLWVREG